MAKQDKNDKNIGWRELEIKVEKENSKWHGTIKDVKTGDLLSETIEKTGTEAHRVLDRRVKNIRKEDKAAAIAKAEAKAKSKKQKGWNAKRYVNHDKDEIEYSKCYDIKSFGDFYNDKTNKAGVQNFCKDCIKAYQKEKRAAKKAEKETAAKDK